MPARKGYIAIRVVRIPPEDNMTPHTSHTQVASMPQVVSIPTIAKVKQKENKKGNQEEAPNAPSSRVPQPYTLCETIGTPQMSVQN